MKKHQKLTKKIIFSILFSVLFIGLVSILNDFTIKQYHALKNTEIDNPRPADSLSSNITINIWLSFSSLSPLNPNRTEPFLWIDTEQPEQNIFYLYVQIINSTNATLSDRDISLTGTMIKGIQNESSFELIPLYNFTVFWDPSSNLFKTNFSLEYKIGSQYEQLTATNYIELKAESKNPNYNNKTEIATIFVARAPSELPSWFHFLAIGTILFLSGIILLIIR